MPEPGRTTEDPDDQRAGEAGRDLTAFRRLAKATRTRLSPARQWLARYEHVPVVAVIAGTCRRDRESAGPVMGSAIAFRLFLSFVPLLLLLVGIAGFASGFVAARTVSRTAGISGSLGAQISAAFHQPGFTRWFALLFGLFGVLTAGRSLSRVLRAASDGYAAELGLATELPAAIAQYRGHWIEYGVAERAYALQCPDDFTAIVSRSGHTAIRPKQYTASAFLATVLGVLSKHGSVLYHLGPATGRWKYNGTISWWAVPPTPDWESSRLSWSGIGRDMSYVPGAADQ